MCLYNVKRVAKVKTGYKIFHVWNKEQTVFGPIYRNESHRYTLGIWAAAIQESRHFQNIEVGYAQIAKAWPTMWDRLGKEEKKGISNFYPVGFHILPDITNLRRFLKDRNESPYPFQKETYIGLGYMAVCKVEYFGELAYGIDYTSEDKVTNNVHCVVASYMKILEVLDHTKYFPKPKPKKKS